MYINNQPPLPKLHIIRIQNNVKRLRRVGVNIWKRITMMRTAI